MTQSTLGTLKRFFSGVGRIFNILGRVVRALITLLLVVGLISWIWVISQSTGDRPVQVPDDGALRIQLDGFLVDESSYVDPLMTLISDDTPNEHLVRDLVKTIDAAAQDERINSIVLVLHDFVGGGSSKVLEVGDALNAFRETGKAVYAVADYYNQQSYLLASHADEIHMHPMGVVELRGLGSYRPYLGEGLDRLRVNFHVFRTSEFKDAIEPLIASEMSDAAREQTRLWLEDIWSVYLDRVATNREINRADLLRYTESLDELMLEYSGDAAQIALDMGLVDRLDDRDQTLAHMVEAIGEAEDEPGFYSYVNYRPFLRQAREGRGGDRENRVGLVVATGTILDGNQPAGSIGGDSLSALLKRTREEEDVKALVVRIDSPGGSAFASELIRRELERYREADIPVVVSMSSVAASGGYWISTPANEIWAQPTSITGSIGAFIAVPTFEDSLSELGIYSDGVGTGPLADAFQLDRPMSEPVKTILQTSLEQIYSHFTELVADSRDMSLEELEPLAEGRVWSGQRARELGLVDELGGLQDALDSAAQLAGLDDYQVYEAQRPLSFREELARLLLERTSAWFPKIDGATANLLRQLGWVRAQLPLDGLQLEDPGHRYLYCADCTQKTGMP